MVQLMEPFCQIAAQFDPFGLCCLRNLVSCRVKDHRRMIVIFRHDIYGQPGGVFAASYRHGFLHHFLVGF